MNTYFQILPLKQWLPEKEKKIIIAGPCSAETEKQLLSTAKAIALINKIHIFRAGIWKPRTRPSTFQGIGEKGLLWLNNVKKKYQLKVITEIAIPKHLELCLKYNIDMVWIGAKTTTNPFAVQALADALKGVDIPVWIKNPVIPDFQLWLGALERINLAGINKLGTIFRGFFPFYNTKYRNYIDWKIINTLQTKIPNLPILIDPSHIGGNTKWINTIMHIFKNKNINGWMIESHIKPDSALSDKNQQITPEYLKKLFYV